MNTPFARERLPHLLELITTNARARWPGVTYLMNSDVAWRLPGSQPKENLRLWYDKHGIAGYAWFEASSPMSMDLRTDLKWTAGIGKEMLIWLEERRLTFPPLLDWLIPLNSMEEWEQALTDDKPGQAGPEQLLQITAFDRDKERIRFLEANGYQATQHFHYSMTRSLEDAIPAPELADGVSIRHVLKEDFPERVATHRDAWFKSSFTIENYLKIRNVDIFDPELDLVSVHADGSFGSYCIAWTDTALEIGSFEPVGTRPSHRRMGLGQEVNYEGLRRMKAKGMHSATIGTAGFNDRAFGLYSSCGFQLIDKIRTYVKVIL